MGRFYDELKRRNVVRVAVVYIIAAWIVMQVVDIMFPALNLPLWTVTAVAALVLIGFPFAIILAWAFELTPDGVKRERDVDRSESITSKTGKKLNQLTIAALVVAVAFLVADKFYSSVEETPPTEQITELAEVKKSIAVLPFVNMSGDAENEYFSDGLSEELLNVLAKIPELHVAGRTSSFKFKGHNEDLRIIGDQLNVANILEGSVRKSATTVRITVQLVDAESGFHLWSETFDRQLTDIFAVQDEIALRVADALKVNLLGQAVEPSQRIHGTNSIEAYDKYLQGLHFRNNYNQENIQKSIAAFQDAIELDPEYARAWAQLAITQWFASAEFSGGDYHEGQATVKESATRAMQLDDTVGEAYMALAMGQFAYEFDFQSAKETLQRGLEIQPNNPRSLALLAAISGASGDLESAIRYSEQSLEIDPLSSRQLRELGDWQRAIGDFDASYETYQHVLDLQPDIARIHGRLGLLFAEQGDLAAAEKEFRREPVEWVREYGAIMVPIMRGESAVWEERLSDYIEKYKENNSFQIAELYSVAGEIDKAYEWLEVALKARDPGLIWVLTFSFTSTIRDDDRWPEFRKRAFGN
jgi:adenylate cyclase